MRPCFLWGEPVELEKNASGHCGSSHCKKKASPVVALSTRPSPRVLSNPQSKQSSCETARFQPRTPFTSGQARPCSEKRANAAQTVYLFCQERPKKRVSFQAGHVRKKLQFPRTRHSRDRIAERAIRGGGLRNLRRVINRFCAGSKKTSQAIFSKNRPNGRFIKGWR